MRKKQLAFTIVSMILVCTFICCMEPLRAYLSVDNGKCRGCRECVRVCQTDAVRIVNGKAVIDPSKCVECGRCVEICPVNAIY